MEIYRRFSILTDYLWKLPRFLDSEQNLEAQKLLEYFPESNDPEQHAFNMSLRNYRFNEEFGKLLIHFPKLMGTSGLIQVVSVFEFSLLEICRDIEKHSGVDLEDFRGKDRGPNRLIGYVEKISPEAIPAEMDQIRRAIDFRNCLVHANGLLAHSNNEDRIRETINKKLYYPLHRRKKTANPKLNLYPRIEKFSQENEEDILVIPVYYAHWLGNTASSSLQGMCAEAIWPQ